MMGEKSKESTGNTYTFLTNDRFWLLAQVALHEFIVNKTDNAFLWSKEANGGVGGYVKVGASYNAYEFAGNKIVFHVDKALSREYPDKAYALCLDLTADKTSNQPPIGMFTLRGGDYITNYIEGVGGKSGLASGPVSSPVAGTHLVAWGLTNKLAA